MSDADSSKYSTSNLAPILAWSIFFCAVWGVLGLLYLACLARWRQWTFSILILLCIAGEIAGYVARIFWYTLRNGAPNNAYLAQIVTLILSPSFMSAALFIFSGELVRYLGQPVSHVAPWVYGSLFTSVDVVSLAVQAIGGAKASNAFNNNTSTASGTHIMAAGIAIQVAALSVFTLALFVMLFRWHKIRRQQTEWAADACTVRIHLSKTGKQFSVALVFATLMLFLRAVYRLVELLEGWTGNLMIHEGYLYGLDALPVILAMVSLIIFHPGRTMGRRIDVYESSAAAAAAAAEKQAQHRDESSV